MDKNKLILSISIVLGCIILGGCYIAGQFVGRCSLNQKDAIKLNISADVTNREGGARF